MFHMAAKAVSNGIRFAQKNNKTDEQKEKDDLKFIGKKLKNFEQQIKKITSNLEKIEELSYGTAKENEQLQTIENATDSNFVALQISDEHAVEYNEKTSENTSSSLEKINKLNLSEAVQIDSLEENAETGFQSEAESCLKLNSDSNLVQPDSTDGKVSDEVRILLQKVSVGGYLYIYIYIIYIWIYIW